MRSGLGFVAAKRVLVETLVDRTTGTKIGDMTGGGGLAAAFNGNTNQAWNAGAYKANATSGYVGKSWGAAKIVSKIVVYPANGGDGFALSAGNVTLGLYLRNGAQANGTDGTLVATIGPGTDPTTVQTLISSDQVNSYDRAWLRILSATTNSDVMCAEMEIYELL